MKYKLEIEKNGKSYILNSFNFLQIFNSSRSIIVNCESIKELKIEIQKILKEINKITK